MTGKKILLEEHGCGYIDPHHEKNSKIINEVAKIGTKDFKVEIVEPLVLFVILQKFDVLNKNGRVYPERVLKKVAKEYMEMINSRTSLGEAEHPSDTVINSSRVTHGITDIWFEGNTMVGKLEMILSPGFVNQGIISCEGDRIANILRCGWTVGVSSRGVGSVEEERGKLIVQDDFELICWDMVLNPSTPGSYVFDDPKKATPFMESVIKEEDETLINSLKKFLAE